MNYYVSIIIPVYNVAKYVVRCMDLLSTQTLSEIEVIFVDDHGQDQSINIIQQYITTHQLSEHWHVLQTPNNQGPGAARNIGINASKGEYIAFVDADDWVESNMMQMLYRLACMHQADVATCSAIMESDDDKQLLLTNPIVQSGIITRDRREYLLRNYVSYLWTMLFKRELLTQHNILFPHTRSSEDSAFIGKCLLMANSIAQTPIPLYHYVVHPNSISHRKGVFRGKDKHESFASMIQFAKSNQLISQYRVTLYWVYFKKVIITSILDYIKSLF